MDEDIVVVIGVLDRVDVDGESIKGESSVKLPLADRFTDEDRFRLVTLPPTPMHFSKCGANRLTDTFFPQI